MGVSNIIRFVNNYVGIFFPISDIPSNYIPSITKTGRTIFFFVKKMNVINIITCTNKYRPVISHYTILVFILITIVICCIIVLPCYIFTLDWIVSAIRKHIISQEALAGAGVAVGVEEPSQGGVVISALEVIEARLRIVVVPAVTHLIRGTEESFDTI